MNSQELKCQKHGQLIIFICTVDKCKEYRYICQQCKLRDTLHFSHHANFIYSVKEFYEFDNGKQLIPRLDKGVQDCETHVLNHKKFYQQQLHELKTDFKTLKDQFLEIADRFEQVYVDQFSKEMNKFDENMLSIKAVLRQFSKEKSSQDSFFTILFSKDSPNKSIDEILTQNSKAFKVRSDIIDLRSAIAEAKVKAAKYKATNADELRFGQLKQHFIEIITGFYNKFKDFLSSTGKSRNNPLKESIVSETRNLTSSCVGSPKGSVADLQLSLTSQRVLQKAHLPEPHPIVHKILSELRPLPPDNNNKRDQGPYRYMNGVYFGNYEGTLRQGRGIFIFNDGCYYEGSWENDQMSGYGRLIKLHCFYEGEIKQGRAHGKGSYQDANRTYTGDWRDDRRHGIGQQQFKAGRKRKYIGLFLNDKYEGRGKLIDEEFVYEGTFKEGLFHGQNCIIKYQNGETFQGFFQNGQKSFGRYNFMNGCYYEGKFKNDISHGPGDFVWTDGVLYSGEWKQGKQDGVGKMTYPDGRVQSGIWKGGNWLKWYS